MPSPTTESPPAPRTGRFRPWKRLAPPDAVPLLLLLLALSTVFLSGHDRGHFYRSWLHDTVTANYLTVAENLSPKHGFLGFYSLTLDDDGAPAYDAYNRFPIGGYLLLKLAMSPFGDDISARIHAARTLMLAFFVLSGVLAWLALRRLVDSRWGALAAVLTAFSSFFMLYYNDMVATEIAPSLFGVMLAFHGMVVFVQEGRFRQLLVKACAALLLGWHVYALLLAFIVLGLARELVRALPLPSRFGRWIQARGEAPAPGRYLALGVVALLFGAALLSFNLGNEYFAFGGKVPLTELPTTKSMAFRFGADEGRNAIYAERLAWLPFLEGQLRRVGGMTLPYGLIEPIWASVVDEAREMELLRGMFALGIVASGVCLLGLRFVRHGMLLAALALSGFCWTLPMRHQSAFHDYDAVFYVGIPLTVFSLVFLSVRSLTGDRFVPVLTAIALAVFVLSSLQMAGVGHGPREAAAEAELMQDFEAIRDALGEGALYVPPGQRDEVAQERLRYFLAGSVILVPRQGRHRAKAGFVILRHRDEGPALLTPDNRRMFLYDRALYDASYDEPALGAPIIASDWNVYWKDGRLIYVSEDCANRKAPFFLSLTSPEAGRPSEHGERHAFDGTEFRLRDVARRTDRKCVAVIDLPERGFASVRTGQLREGEPLWEGEYRPER